MIMPQPKVVIYTKEYCPYCQAAKQLLSDKEISFEEVDVTHEEGVLEKLIEKTRHQTVPQVFIGERFVGGFQELKALDQSGELNRLLDISC